MVPKFTISGQKKICFQGFRVETTLSPLRCFEADGITSVSYQIPRQWVYFDLSPRAGQDASRKLSVMPAVTPSTLLITKTKRWFFVDEPSRPLSQRKAARDLEDIKVLLEWLSSKV
ncbi:unnamed protein product [Penicillium salamii]|uniref:Uncharacterized protein n=1 Tax=Penicillium salamii TaxID=1612424 RepID=A0A9W4N5Z3_9EURO|nr:unnamed protein product [Penicillium salamii]